MLRNPHPRTPNELPQAEMSGQHAEATHHTARQEVLKDLHLTGQQHTPGRQMFPAEGAAQQHQGAAPESIPLQDAAATLRRSQGQAEA